MIRLSGVFATTVSGLILFGPETARAHAFSRSGMVESFLEGTVLPLTASTILLCLLPLGLLIGLGRKTNAPHSVLAALIGIVAAMPVAPATGPVAEPVAVLVGAVLAAFAALLPGAAKPVTMALALIGGFAAGLSALTGHAWGEVPPPIYPGLLLGGFILVGAAAGAVIRTREYVSEAAGKLAWRVGASWCGATALIYAAFEGRAYF
ncbi:MAG: hypothetical protein P1U37_08885 [Minwuia sp.]|nr:hypothetical protein [Minwuia sp.]